MISCILLAAGLSQRFGSPKALAQIHHQPAILHIQQTLLKSSCNEIIIVLGAAMEMIQPYVLNHKRIRIVYNKDYNFGQTSSIKAGIKAVDNAALGLMFWPVDCPLINASSVDTLIECFLKESPAILIPTYQDKRGHPPLFHKKLKEEILNLPLDKGLNSLFLKHQICEMEINDAGIIKSFNTKEEKEKLN